MRVFSAELDLLFGRWPRMTAVSQGCPEYVLQGAKLPHRLRDLPSPPSCVFVRGVLPRGVCVAIVGTRVPTAGAERFAAELAYAVASAGGVVVSGGARGIDAAAHEGALGAGGPTLVVVPSGLDRPYPSEHQALFARVTAAGGALLSPFDAGTEARRHRFFRRNECLASLCHALVLVEAPVRSGARNAASWARKLGRSTFAVPSAPWNPRGRGCLLELGLGAELLSEPDAFVRRIGLSQAVSGTSAAAPVAPPLGLAVQPPRPPFGRGSEPVFPAQSDLQACLLERLVAGPETLDSLAEYMTQRVSEVQHALLRLTLSGQVERGPCGRFRLPEGSPRPGSSV